MQDQPKRHSAGHVADPMPSFFQLLGIDPAATRAEVERAVVVARGRNAIPDPLLTKARDCLLDPARRLLCELCYPLDGSAAQVAAFKRDLSGSLPAAGLLPAANALPPLSKANFLASIAARGPAGADLLIALVEAHAAIETTAVFDALRDYRYRSGVPMPSLVDTAEGVRELLSLHASAAMAGFESAPSAARALLACVRQIVSSQDRYQVEALSGLLDAYRESLGRSDLDAGGDIDAACTAILQRPADDAAVRQFETALVRHVAAVAPLALFDSHRSLGNAVIDKIAARTRLLLADLIAAGEHRTARNVIATCLEAFSVLPGSIEPFNEAAAALQELELEIELRPLATLIQEFDGHPSGLVADIGKAGFGERSSGQARRLWEAFSAAVTATRQTTLQERPWIRLRDFVLRLAARPESAAAATRMMADLLRAGQALPIAPSILDSLRNDLNALEAGSSSATASRGRATRYLRMALLSIVAPVLGLGAFFVHQHLDALLPSKTPASQSSLPPKEEAIPPAGKGERFKLEFVRYCHFQEERLRIIKPHVRGPEDVQAFNMLANDYNSRCSNFYYRDEDLKIVMEEVRARKQMLEADALRILSTWPWHAAPDNPPNPN